MYQILLTVRCVVGHEEWLLFPNTTTDFCDAGWRNTRDALLGTGFALFLLALLIITILNIIAALVGCYARKLSPPLMA